MAIAQDWRPLRRPMAASSPRRGAKVVQCLRASVESLPRSAAPFRGSGTRCRRGRRRGDTSRGEKRGRTINIIVGDGRCAVPLSINNVQYENRRARFKTPCHCETGAHTGRGNPFSFTWQTVCLLLRGNADSHVASLLGMTGGLYIAASFIQWW